MLEAIVYVMESDCSWRDLPSRLGRDPQAFGIDAWVRSSSSSPDQWHEAADR